MNSSNWRLFTSCLPETYHTVIDYVISSKGVFSLTALEGRYKSVWPMWHVIRNHLIHEECTTETPIGYKSLSLVRTFRACEGMRDFLMAPGSIFSWRHPEWPEDLCLYDAAMVPWLITVSHEEYILCDLSVVPECLRSNFEI
jgi:hypothetical protein